MALDVKTASEDERVARTVDFLSMLKCPFLMPATDEEGEAMLVQGLLLGDKATLFPVLAWCLNNLSHLHRRAYLGRYLMPVDVPFDHSQTQDPTLADLHARFRGLQEEFTSVHKAFEEVRAAIGTTNSCEIRAQIKQLEEEKHQLEENVERMARVGQREVGFNEMLSLTRAVREEEEDERRLRGKLAEERHAFEISERRVQALGLALEEEGKRRRGRKGGRSRTPFDIQDQATAEMLVEELQEEVRRLRYQVTEQLPLEIEKAQLYFGRKEGIEGRHQHQNQQRQQLERVGREDMEKVVYDVKRAELHVQYWKAKIDEKIIKSGGAINPSSNNGKRKAEEGRRERGKERGSDDKFLHLRERALVAAIAGMEKEGELEMLLLRQQQQQQQLDRLSVDRRVHEQAKERLESQITSREGYPLYQGAGAKAAVAARAERGVEVVGVTRRSMKDAEGCGADGDGDGDRGTQDELTEALRKINEELREEKRRLQPLVKVLKEGRKEAGILEEEHRLRKAQYERVMMMSRREGVKEDREGEREMLALKTLLEVKLSVEGDGRGRAARQQPQQQY